MVDGKYLCLRPPAVDLEKRILYLENAMVRAPPEISLATGAITKPQFYLQLS